MMEVNIVHSGSSGNSAVIDQTIMIDAGWYERQKARYILITHHHSDHIKHLKEFSGLPIYCTRATHEYLRGRYPFTEFTIIEPNRTFFICEYEIEAIPLKHDVPCVGYRIAKVCKETGETFEIFFATDFHQIEDEEAFINALKKKRFDALYIECNNSLNVSDFNDCYFGEHKPKDEFHRRRSFQNHCNVEYLIALFHRAGYSKTQRFTEPVMLLHKSSFYYQANIERIVDLCATANIINPLY